MLSPGTQEFDDITQCGTGAYAKVYSAIHCLTGSAVAIKVFDLKKTQDCPNVVDQEISIHRKLDHPFIAQYFGHIREEETVSMIMEYVQGIPLIELVNQSGYIRELEAQKMFCELVSAVYYLHRVKRIVHRDLKLENILLTPQRHVKLIDFGFARENSGVMTTQCASFPYAAPEVFMGKTYTEAVDVWSLGVILYAMLVGALPFGSGDIVHLSKRVCNEEPEYPETLGQNVVDLLKKMFVKNPEERIDIDGVRKHPWMQRTRFALLMDEAVVLTPDTITYPVVGVPDNDTVEQCKELGVDTEHIPWDNFEEADDHASMIYRIVRRAAISKGLSMFCSSVVMPRINTKDRVSKSMRLSSADETDTSDSSHTSSLKFRGLVSSRETLPAGDGPLPKRSPVAMMNRRRGRTSEIPPRTSPFGTRTRVSKLPPLSQIKK